eukprot:878012-Pyramimonas_sp.AAC.1
MGGHTRFCGFDDPHGDRECGYLVLYDNPRRHGGPQSTSERGPAIALGATQYLFGVSISMWDGRDRGLQCVHRGAEELLGHGCKSASPCHGGLRPRDGRVAASQQ